MLLWSIRHGETMPNTLITWNSLDFIAVQFSSIVLCVELPDSLLISISVFSSLWFFFDEICKMINAEIIFEQNKVTIFRERRTKWTAYIGMDNFPRFSCPNAYCVLMYFAVNAPITQYQCSISMSMLSSRSGSFNMSVILMRQSFVVQLKQIFATDRIHFSTCSRQNCSCNQTEKSIILFTCSNDYFLIVNFHLVRVVETNEQFSFLSWAAKTENKFFVALARAPHIIKLNGTLFTFYCDFQQHRTFINRFSNISICNI